MEQVHKIFRNDRMIDFSEYKKSSFSPAFFCLSKNKKEALKVIYAFCRIADDMADDLNKDAQTKKKELEEFRALTIKAFNGEVRDDFFKELSDKAKIFLLKKDDFLSIIDGVLMDVDGVEYNSFEDLKIYMRRVASAPGSITLDICGFEGERKLLAENLGFAVQLTNIIRDFYEDAKIKRFYIPKEYMERFKVNRTEIGLKSGVERQRDLLAFCSQKAYGYYDASFKLMQGRKGKQAPLVILNVYKRLLDKIVNSDFDIVEKIPKINMFEKLTAIVKSF
jgi:phytoene synthase